MDEGWIMAEWLVFVVCCLQGRIFICTSRFKLYLCHFPEASKHTGDELSSLPPDRSCVDFFSANGEDLWFSVDEKIFFVLTHCVVDGKVTNNSRCSKWRFWWSSSRKCRKEKFLLRSSWRAKRVCFPIGKAFQKAKLGSRKGFNVLLLPKSVSNLSSICRASFWRIAFQLAMGYESRFKDYSSLCVSLSSSCRYGMPVS